MALKQKFLPQKLIKRHPWLTTPKKDCVISPDVDGMLCGLLMSHFLNWNIVGYYDGKQLAINRGINPNKCIFLDMEIFRKPVKSCGHHMILFNKKQVPSSWKNFNNCLNPNLIRGYDVHHDFPQKYPFATIHLLLCIIGYSIKINIEKSAITPLLYVDGVFKNLFNYPENCISWLEFLNAKDPNSPIYPLYVRLANRKIPQIIHGLENIFKIFKRYGDKIILSEISNGEFSCESKTRVLNLINSLSELTGWNFNKNKWSISNLCILNFSKKIVKLNKENYNKIIKKIPLSWAITARNRIEYTIERPDKFI